MLSRIRHDEVAVIDTSNWVDTEEMPEEEIKDILPLIHDGLDLAKVSQGQKAEFSELWTIAQDIESEYEVMNNVLYSTKQPTQPPPSIHDCCYHPHTKMP